MEHLDIDPVNNKFVYQSDEPCVLPTNKAPETQQPSAPSGSQEGTAGTDMGKTGGIVGTTGSMQGRIFSQWESKPQPLVSW